MIQVSFPDGNIKTFHKGITALEIAESISNQLSKKVLVAQFNDNFIDVSTSLNQDGAIKFYTWQDSKGKETFWHSSAHLMAEAIESLFPGVQFWVGPPLEQGFYYDIDFGDHKLNEAELQLIEDKINVLLQTPSQYIRKQSSKKEALEYFTAKGDVYKLDLLQKLEDGQISLYTQGNFTDLCRGPHIPNTSFIKFVKLNSIAGAYWKGDEKNKMLTRIYGISFPNKKELDDYLLLQEEIKKRDHRKIGKDLSIYTYDDDIGPGLVLWMPNGAAIIEELEKLAKDTEQAQGYKRVVTPHIAKENLYITSGHLPYYKESMFPPMVLDGTNYYLKSNELPTSS